MRPAVWTVATLSLGLSLGAGCHAPSDPGKPDAGGDDSAASGDGGDDGDDGGTDGGDDTAVALHGTPPESPVPAPTFAATNRDGAARDRQDLLGHPTVLWFYPAAASSG